MVHVTPNPILVGERIQQLDMLLHIQEFSTMIAVITGDPKMGKTALLDSAVAQLSIHHQVIHFSVLDYQSEESVVQFIAQQLGAAANSWSEILKTLSDIKALDESVNLIIDDAHLLTKDTLTLLCEISIEDAGWHIMLAGDWIVYESLQVIQTELHHTNLIHHIDLSPISAEESVELASIFFKKKGRDNLVVSSQKIKTLWQLSEGIPGKLIELLEGELESKQEEESRFPLGHIAAICLIALALGASFFYQNDSNEIDELEKILATEYQTENDNLQLSKKNSLPAMKSIDKPEAARTNAQAVKVESKAEKVKAVSALGEKSVAKNEVKVAKVITPEGLTASKNGTIQTPSNRRLLDASPNEFALQLLGVRNKASAESVLEKFKKTLETDQLSIYETIYKGQPWYVVVYGPMKSKAAASKQANVIAKALNNKPWVRPMLNIQEDMKKAKR